MKFRTATIPTKRAIHTLEHLHAELAGKLAEAKHEVDRLMQAMKHVEAVLKLLVPGYDVRPIAIRRRKHNPWFKRGTALRAVLAVLRTAEKPLTAREISERMLKAKGVTDPDRVEFHKLVGSISSALTAPTFALPQPPFSAAALRLRKPVNSPILFLQSFTDSRMAHAVNARSSVISTVAAR